MKQLVKTRPETNFITPSEIKPTDIVVSVWQNQVGILSKVEYGMLDQTDCPYGFLYIENGRVDWHTRSETREKVIQRAAEGSAQTYVFSCQADFFREAAKQGWIFFRK